MQITDEFILKEAYKFDVTKIPLSQITDFVDLVLNYEHKKKRALKQKLSAEVKK